MEHSFHADNMDQGKLHVYNRQISSVLLPSFAELQFDWTRKAQLYVTLYLHYICICSISEKGE